LLRHLVATLPAHDGTRRSGRRPGNNRDGNPDRFQANAQKPGSPAAERRSRTRLQKSSDDPRRAIRRRLLHRARPRGGGAAPALALCRKLVEAGHDPAPALEAYRGETLCLHIRSIGEAAGLTVEDSRHGTPRFRRWHGAGAGVTQRYGRASPIAPIGPGPPGAARPAKSLPPTSTSGRFPSADLKRALHARGVCAAILNDKAARHAGLRPKRDG
jgi:hypothetical protein